MSDQDAVITLKDVFTQVTKLVGHIDAINQRNLMADQIHKDHEDRLRSLEKWRYALPVSLIVGLGSIAVALSPLVHK